MNAGPIDGPEIGLLEFTQSALIVDPAVSRDRIAREAFSASTMKAVDGCPARMAVDKAIDKQIDQFGAAELGTAGHTSLEQMFTLEPRYRTRDRLMRIIQKLAVETFPGPAEKMAGIRGLWTTEVWNAVAGVWDMLDPADVVVHKLEWRIEDVLIAGVPFRGFVDISRRVDGGLTVDDWKSSKKLPRINQHGDAHGDQLRLYHKAVEIITGEKPVEANLFYTRLGTRKAVALSPSRMKDTVERFQSGWHTFNALVERSQYPCKTSALCGWCPLVGSCVAAARDGFEQRNQEMRLVTVPVEQVRYHVAAELDPVEVAVHADAANDPYDDRIPEIPEHDHLEDDMANTADDTRFTPPLKLEREAFHEDVNGQINPASYAFRNLTTTVKWALFYLERRGVEVTQDAVEITADVIENLSAEVQRQLSGSTNWQRGLRTQALYAVRQALWSKPIPFGESDEEALDRWREAVIRRAVNVMRVSIAMWERTDQPVDPHLDLRRLVPTKDETGADLMPDTDDEAA